LLCHHDADCTCASLHVCCHMLHTCCHADHVRFLSAMNTSGHRNQHPFPTCALWFCGVWCINIIMGIANVSTTRPAPP
jgi:hypothetical protein